MRLTFLGLAGTCSPPALHHALNLLPARRYLTRDFFHQLGERMADRVLLVVAESEKGERRARAAVVLE